MVNCNAAAKPLSDESLLAVLSYQVNRQRSFVLWHVGELSMRPALASRMAQILGK